MKNDAPALLTISGLKFSYEAGKSDIGRGFKGTDVLDIESLTIPSGGCHAVLGPNGCGKTTLLKIIAGLLEPAAGNVEKTARAVLVHQHPYLLSGSVFSNVAYGLKIRKLSSEEIRVRVIGELERWGLLHLKDRHSARLSGGEKQRTAIARAMVLKPDILLLDEPTASVDPDNILQMESLISDVAETGTTVILSTHHIDFSYRIADTIIRLKKGKPVSAEENIISGTVTERDEFFNIFETSGTRLYSPGRDGSFRRAVFSVNDVILSRDEVKSSARNVLESEVVSVKKESGTSIIELEAGFRFRARVSNISVDELELTPGRKVYALLKSSSVVLY